MSRILYTNNPSAYVNQILDRVAGKPEFGDSWANKKMRISDVPADLRKVVSAMVHGKDTFQTSELERNLDAADYALTQSDRGIFGAGGILNTGLGGGNGIISAREQKHAMKKNEFVKPVLDYIFETDGR
ncbi:MAG: hypothetical protein ACJ790_18345 [Myxococcaceae bacterium]